MKRALIISYVALVAVVLFTPQLSQSEPQHRIVIRSFDRGDHQIIFRDGEFWGVRGQAFDVSRDHRFRGRLFRMDRSVRLRAYDRFDRLGEFSRLRARRQMDRVSQFDRMSVERLGRLNRLRMDRLDRINRLRMDRLDRWNRIWRDRVWRHDHWQDDEVF